MKATKLRDNCIGQPAFSVTVTMGSSTGTVVRTRTRRSLPPASTETRTAIDGNMRSPKVTSAWTQSELRLSSLSRRMTALKSSD